MTIPKAVPLHVKFDDEQIKAMKDNLMHSPFPSKPPMPTANPWELGVDIAWIETLKERFANQWTWSALEKRINAYPNYIVPFGEDAAGLDLHFVHARSQRADAIPLVLLHGWPGTFFDFHKIIDPLVNPADGDPAFHVVVPSLPGYIFSTQPSREKWTVVDTARIIHRLMVEVLGYGKYCGQGGDWGSYILRIIGNLFPNSAVALHFNMFRCRAVDSVDAGGFSAAEKNILKRRDEFARTGRGYFEIQSTKPFTIGLAIATSPLALLFYIGEKYHAWSDPAHLDPNDVLDTVALYYLSGSFATSVLTYYQNSHIRDEMTADDQKWRVASKIGFTSFPYEIGGAPKAHISAVGPLVFYKERNKGGHFPALDNPVELVEDLREFFGSQWKTS